MGDWAKMAAGVLSFGFMLDMFAISGNNAISGEKHAVEALEICGFLCLMLACVLALASVFGDLKGNRGAFIAMTLFAFAGGVLIITGLAIYGTRVNENLPPYSATLLVCAGFLSIIGGIFGAVGLSRS